MADFRIPPFPVPPPGLTRLSHLPTVNAGLLYWGAIRAASRTDSPEHQTAETMEDIYAAARGKLLSGASSPALRIRR